MLSLQERRVGQVDQLLAPLQMRIWVLCRNLTRVKASIDSPWIPEAPVPKCKVRRAEWVPMWRWTRISWQLHNMVIELRNPRPVIWTRLRSWEDLWTRRVSYQLGLLMYPRLILRTHTNKILLRFIPPTIVILMEASCSLWTARWGRANDREF